MITAVGEYYNWKLAQRIYGPDSNEAWALLALTTLSPWQWFCSTRTLSNCLETTLTIIALYNWPWQWALTPDGNPNLPVDEQGLRMRDDQVPDHERIDETTRLRRSLIFAALATVLRPTNALIWLTLGTTTLLQRSTTGWLLRIPWTEQSAWIHFTAWSFVPSYHERRALFGQAASCGFVILVLSIFIDRFYYQTWTFPPFNFLMFNVVQSLAVFYGNNDWHYYITQGYPLLLTTALPFALVGQCRALHSISANLRSPTAPTTLSQLATISLVVPAALSIISHKEVRFIYPVLPILHVLCASPLVSFFGPSVGLFSRERPSTLNILLKRTFLTTLISVNLAIAVYTTTVHNSGLSSVTSYLRHQQEKHYLPSSRPTNMTVAFLMPCHSTAWRSHMLYPPTSTSSGIEAWALSCEPPLHLNGSERASYIDEADIFYVEPLLWLRKTMSRHPPRPQGIFGSNALPRRRDVDVGPGRRRNWPDYLVFFEQLESVMDTALRGSGYRECWRHFNSHWHDDWRRQGDVVVWCLFPERRDLEPGKSNNTVFQFVGTWARGAQKRIQEDVIGHASVERAGKWARSAQKQVQDKLTVDLAPRRPDGQALGGGRGPWGIGGDVSHRKDQNRVGEPVVDRTFWRKRDKPVAEHNTGLRDQMWPFGNTKKKRWWEGGVWS